MILLIWRTNSDFAIISLALAKPRSAKTFPLPAVLLAILGISAPLISAIFFPGFFQTPANHIQLSLRRGDAAFGLLHEAMQYVNQQLQPDGVNATVGIAVFRIRKEFAHTRKVAVQRPLIPGSLAELHEMKTVPEFAPGVDRKSTRLNSSHLGISYAV